MKEVQEGTKKALAEFLEEKCRKSANGRRVVMSIQADGLTTEEMFLFVNSFISNGDFRIVRGGKSHLRNLIAETIKWEECTAVDATQIILASAIDFGTFCEDVLFDAVKYRKLPNNQMMDLIRRKEFKSESRGILAEIIKTGGISDKDLLEIIKISGYAPSVLLEAIKTERLTAEQLLFIWSESKKDYDIALIIAETGLVSKKDLKKMSGDDCRFLKDLNYLYNNHPTIRRKHIKRTFIFSLLISVALYLIIYIVRGHHMSGYYLGEIMGHSIIISKWSDIFFIIIFSVCAEGVIHFIKNNMDIIKGTIIYFVLSLVVGIINMFVFNILLVNALFTACLFMTAVYGIFAFGALGRLGQCLEFSMIFGLIFAIIDSQEINFLLSFIVGIVMFVVAALIMIGLDFTPLPYYLRNKFSFFEEAGRR